jgi:hypothetical protein
MAFSVSPNNIRSYVKIKENECETAVQKQPVCEPKTALILAAMRLVAGVKSRNF